MKRVLIGLAALAAATASFAQTAPVTYDAYIEAHRPTLAVRTLGADELAAAKKAISAWNSKKTEANLLAVKPWAEAGHPDAMKTMVKGYEHLLKSKKDRGPSAALARPEQGLIPMSGIWALRTGVQLGWTKPLAKTAQLCISPYTRVDYDHLSSILDDYHCGVEVEMYTAASIKAKIDGITSALTSQQPRDVPVLTDAGLRDARANRIFAKFGNDYRTQWSGISAADRAWITAEIAADPDMSARYDAARFDMYVKGAKKGDDYQYSADKAWLEQYAAADPKRANELATASADYRNKLARERASFNSNMARATEIDRYRLAQVAFREGGQMATDWYAKFGATLKPGEFSAYQWCDRGVATACADAKYLDDLQQARVDRAEEELAKRLHRPDSAGSGGGGESVAEMGARVNAENCARASLGANIQCNPN
jgi:hypothetical protein